MSANPKDTLNFLESFKQFRHPRSLGDTGLSVSPFGFGSYRVLDSVAAHKAALNQSLAGGVNLIDTSSNYSDGASEKLIGQALREGINLNHFTREQMVVVSKVGYVQGSALKEMKHRKSNSKTIKDMVEFHPQAWHCIHPEYIDYSIEQSLSRLGVSSLDVYLLHNPEYYFKESADHGDYYKRIKLAFEHLESLVDQGKISFYGISSNTFPSSSNSGDFTSLEKCLELAKSIKENHHFRVVQMPVNLIENSAFTENNNDSMSAIAFAQKNNLAVLGNRPFNAFRQDQLVRLVSFAKHDEAVIKGRLHTELQQLIAHEREFEQISKLPQEVAWGQNLRDHLQEITDSIEWREILNQQILPIYQDAIQKLPPSEEIRAWRSAHQKKLYQLLSTLTQNYENQSAIVSDHVKAQILDACPKVDPKRTLSQIVLQLYLASPGVSSMLVGMRNPTYVGDVLDTPLDLDLNQDELKQVFSQIR